MDTKTCSKCHVEKPFAQFNKKKKGKHGIDSICNSCKSTYYKAYYQKNKPYMADRAKEYHAKYGLTPQAKGEKREYDKQRYSDNPKAAKERAARWAKTENGRQYRRKLSSKMRRKYPDRVAARNAVYRARKQGKIPEFRELPCHICGKQAQSYHHHKGYSRKHWLDVLPICRKCHNDTENPFIVNK